MNKISQNLGFTALIKKQNKTKPKIIIKKNKTQKQKTLNVSAGSQNPEFSFWMILLVLSTPSAFVISAYKYGLV